jgi:RNA polymerase sigma-70 factor (ECF subfamily)
VADPEIDIEGLKQLDPAAVSAVHERFFPQIYQYARYRVPDDQTAEDITGEVFLRLLEGVQRGKGPRKSVRGWLFGTVSNLVHDHYRSTEGRSMQKLTEEIPAQAPGPGRWAEELDRMRVIRAALNKLTPEQQDVLALRFGSELSVADTAKVMEKNENAVKGLQFRALRALRRRLGVT